tara:strand:- start:2615 stop:3580 length:966 start_codon:yes stop_codon:yes gene_type:complete
MNPFLKKELQKIEAFYPSLLDDELFTKQINIKNHTFINPNVERFTNVISDIRNMNFDFMKESFKTDEIKFDFNGDEILLSAALKKLIPWRKGPFQFNNLKINAEWDSSLKWKRIESFIDEKRPNKILDVGCSNGYFMWKSLAFQPKSIIGIDPSDLCFFQYQAVLSFVKSSPNLALLPLRLDDVKSWKNKFDLINCLGVIYHHRDPVTCLRQCYDLLQKNGRLILESIVIPGNDDMALFPKSRYANMRNVYFIPTINCMKNWLIRAGFKQINALDMIQTTSEEQRTTEWTWDVSLEHGLSENNKTKEGYPGVFRSIIIADK